MNVFCCVMGCMANATIHITVGPSDDVAAAGYTRESYCSREHMVEFLAAEPDLVRRHS